MHNTQSMVVDIRRVASAHGMILFDASLLPQATPESCGPDMWADAQPLGGRGGRGAALLVRGPFGEGVLRHYRRGGLVGRCNQDSYLFLGESNVRCVREFRLLVELHRRGLPVPQPVFARWQRRGLFYRADLLTRLVPAARTLAECLQQARDRVPWRLIGATIARFHHEGVFHADLNAHNILLDAPGSIWLIDFDRGRLRRSARAWQEANLRRLQRSLDKLGGVSGQEWGELRDAYDAAMDQAAAAAGGR